MCKIPKIKPVPCTNTKQAKTVYMTIPYRPWWNKDPAETLTTLPWH